MEGRKEGRYHLCQSSSLDMKPFVYWVLCHLLSTLTFFMACLKIFYYTPKINEGRLECTGAALPLDARLDE